MWGWADMWIVQTISCLLIYPNPDSALNSAAGALQQEDYEAFARQAKVMTSIHAPVPADMKSAVMEAKLRGEEAGAVIQEQHEDSRALQTRKGTKVQSVTMKKKETSQSAQAHSAQQQQKQSLSPLPPPTTDQDEIMTSSDAENENDENNTTESKENDPSLSPSPVKFAPPSPRKNAHGKRPLSVLTMPLDHAHSHYHTHDQTSPPPTMMDTDEDGMMMTASKKNIAANANHQESIPEEDEDRGDASPRRKSPKLSTLNKGVNASGRIRDEIFEDTPPTPSTHHRRTKTTGKENHDYDTLADANKEPGKAARRNYYSANATTNPNFNTHPVPTLSSASSSASASLSAAPDTTPTSLKGTKAKGATRSVSGARKVSKPRIGLRRL